MEALQDIGFVIIDVKELGIGRVAPGPLPGRQPLRFLAPILEAWRLSQLPSASRRWSSLRHFFGDACGQSRRFCGQERAEEPRQPLEDVFVTLDSTLCYHPW